MRTPNDRAVKAQLEKVLASRTFSKSERLSGFLSFVVSETLRGAGDGLKEAVIARELYGKQQDFDTTADPTVRIDARRLRDKLREYYSEYAGDPVLISVPKGQYAPVFSWNPQAPEPAVALVIRAEPHSAPAQAVYRRPWFLIAASLCLLASIAAAIWLLRTDPGPLLVSLPLTALAGSEGPPSLSPDGQTVAFEWLVNSQPPSQHIYLKDVHGVALRPLTDSPLFDRNPSWSPDGSKIAFIRGRQGAFVVSKLGGDERNISPTATQVSWAADSKSILIRDTAMGGDHDRAPNGIYQVFLDTLERRRITQAIEGVGDWRCSVSPDGKTLAFIRFGTPGIADVHVKPMSGGEPRRITDWASSVVGLDWTPDGREIVFSVGEPQGSRLRRIPWNVSKPGKGTLVSGQTGEALYPSISRPGPNAPARLAYQVQYLDVGLRLVDLSVISDGVLTSVQSLADSTRLETAARFSADGTKVAFSSNLSGNREIWSVDRDGSHVTQLTFMGAPMILPSGWSLDRRSMLFQAAVNGNTDVYVLPLGGGRIQRMTDDPRPDVTPAWSRDGKWIYFASSRSHIDGSPATQIWKMPAAGGPAVQLTKNGGFFPQESFDGQFVYYLDHPQTTVTDIATVMRIPVGGGDETEVLKGIHGMLWWLTREGIFFLSRDKTSDIVNLYQPDDKTPKPVGRLNFPVAAYGNHMTVSADGRWLITGQMNRNESDLMLIDSFR